MSAPVHVLVDMSICADTLALSGSHVAARALQEARDAVAELIEAAKLVRRCGNGGARLDRTASDAIRAALTRVGGEP